MQKLRGIDIFSLDGGQGKVMERCGSCTILRALSAVQRDAETMLVAGTALHACLST